MTQVACRCLEDVMPESWNTAARTVAAESVDFDTPKLITAGPALALVQRWRSELSVLRHRSPTSDAVTTLADCVVELLDAIDAGHDIRLQISIADAHALSDIPVSTLRWLCEHKPELVGAQKHESIWYIDREQFERYLANVHVRSPEAA